MSKSIIIVKNFCENFIFILIQTNILFSVLITNKIGVTRAIPSGVHVDGYNEEEVPIYPFQQYIQVRKTYTVEHVPVYHQESSSPANLQASASNSHGGGSNDHHTASQSSYDEHGNDGGGGGQYHHVPRLREEISDYKKQEVYEEKGYGDSAFDHHSYKQPTNYYHHPDNREEDSSDRSIAESSSMSKNVHGNGRQQWRQPQRHALHSPDGSSTKILEYVASNLHDHDAQQKGIYAARSNIHCPEVIDFDLSSKSMAMGKGRNRGAKPRLSGLGSKIDCLKNKYFGSEPLPRAIFAEPSESKEAIIQVPSFNNFFSMVRRGVNSMSSFQNSNVPI